VKPSVAWDSRGYRLGHSQGTSPPARVPNWSSTSDQQQEMEWSGFARVRNSGSNLPVSSLSARGGVKQNEFEIITGLSPPRSGRLLGPEPLQSPARGCCPRPGAGGTPDPLWSSPAQRFLPSPAPHAGVSQRVQWQSHLPSPCGAGRSELGCTFIPLPFPSPFFLSIFAVKSPFLVYPLLRRGRSP